MNLTEAVAMLPDTPDGIADLMRDLHITGRLGSPRACPVAKYLRGVTGEPILVGIATANTSPMDALPVHLPRPVREFVLLFDLHEYADLIDPTTPEEDES